MSWIYNDMWKTVSIRRSPSGQDPLLLDLIAFGSAFIVFLTFIFILAIFWKRRRAYDRLTRAGLPTIYWYPKWINSAPSHLCKESSTSSSKAPYGSSVGGDDLSYNILSSSNITNILPRMLRLRGPYDMYGTIYGASTAVVHVAHPTPAYTILCGGGARSNGTNSAVPITQKSPAYDHFKNFCGNGVFTADGEEWKTKRAAVLHALLMRHRPTPSERGTTTGSTQTQPAEMGFYNRIAQESNRSASELIDVLDAEINAVEQNHKGATYNTNMVSILQRATIGLIYRYITHDDFMKEEKWTPDIYCEKQHSQFTLTDDSETKGQRFIQTYLQSITRIRMILLAQSRSIWFVLPRWFYRTFAKLYQEEEYSIQSIRQMAILACRSAKPNSPLGQLRCHPVYCTAQNRTFSEKIANGTSTEESYANNFSENLIEEAITLLFAGQDTSAATLSWTLHLLTLYPNVQETLFSEIQSVLNGESNHDDTKICPTITRKHIAMMPYLDAIIKESMRLYPVAPFIVRKLLEDVDVSSVGPSTSGQTPHVLVPSNSVACIWIYSLHRHPDFWKRPSDFLPERWLASQTIEALDSPTVKRDLGITTPGAYIPFALGARNCLGQPLANIVLRIILARLIYRYEFQDDRVTAIQSRHPTNDEPLLSKEVDQLRRDMQAGFTVLPQGGLPLSIRHRS